MQRLDHEFVCTNINEKVDDENVLQRRNMGQIGNLVKPLGIKLEIAKVKRASLSGSMGWFTADLYIVDTYTNGGDQSYAWHMHFDESGTVPEVKAWLDILTLETVLCAEAAKLNGTSAMGKSVLRY